MYRVLVLNATLEPLNTVSVPRAVSLLLSDKAELVEVAEAQLRSQRATLPVPLVIRLVTYVRIPRLMPLIVTRRGIFNRDRFTCQYRGCSLPPADLTLDHVLPRCRGGKTTWETSSLRANPAITAKTAAHPPKRTCACSACRSALAIWQW